MAKNTGDPRGPGMPGSGGWVHTQDDGPQNVQIKSSLGDVVFSFDDVYPWDGVYVREDDMLQVELFTLATPTLNLQYRILRPDGTVLVSQDAIAATASRTQSFVSRQLAEGILLSVALFPVVAVVPSLYAYASIGLRRQNLGTASLHQVLAAGYLTQACPLSWPGHTLQRPTDGGGALRSITGSVPAAGADISEAVPANTRWQLLSLRASLTTAVAVASRQPKITLDDGALRFYDTGDGPAQAASLTWAYTFAPTGSLPTNSLTDVQIHYDNAQILGPGFRIRTLTAAIQAADQWTAPQYLVREWQDGA
jgi:hypothetical protein